MGETGKLEGERAEFGNGRALAGFLLGASEVFFPSPLCYGHAVRGVEAAVEEVADFECFFQQFRVVPAADVVGPEETTHVADGGFEHVDSFTLRLAKVDVVQAPERLLELFFHPQNPEGVQGIDQRCRPSTKAINVSTRHRADLILEPRVFLVSLPRVFETGLHSRLPVQSFLLVCFTFRSEVMLELWDFGELASGQW